MERVWLILGIGLIIFITYICIDDGFENNAINYLFPAIALGMYFMRRFMRRRMEKLIADKMAEAEEQGAESNRD